MIRRLTGPCGASLVAIAAVTQTFLAAQEPFRSTPRMAVFTPDGKFLAVATGEADQKGTLSVWDVATFRRIWVHKEPRGFPCVAFAPDGKTLAAGTLTADAKLFDTASGAKRATYGGHGRTARSVGFAPDGKLLAVGTDLGFIKLWDLAKGTEVRTVRGHSDRVFTVVFSADGKRLLSAGTDAARLWDVATGREERVLRHDGFLVHAGIFAPDGQFVLTGGWDGSARLWDLSTGKQIWRIEGPGVDCLAYSPGTDMLAACGHARKIQLVAPVFRKCTEHEAKRLHGLIVQLDDDSYELREAASLAIAQMGLVAEPALRQAQAESHSPEVRLRCKTLRRALFSKPQAQLNGHADDVESVAFSPDGTTLASAGHDGTVRLWDVPAHKERGRLVPSLSAR